MLNIKVSFILPMLCFVLKLYIYKNNNFSRKYAYFNVLKNVLTLPSPHHPLGHGPQTGPANVSRHSTFGKQIGGSSEHSGFFI